MNMTSEELSNIFTKLKKGDEEAFSFFYKYYINDLYSYGKSLCIDDEYVMDAIQDVFLKVFFNKPQLYSVEHFKYFLLKSLKNRLYDLFKSKYFSDATDIKGDIFNFSIKTTVLDEIIEEEDRMIIQQKVERLLNILSPQQKEAVYLRYIQELDYEQISEIMEKNETSVRKLVSSAIHKIRRENPGLSLISFIMILCCRF